MIDISKIDLSCITVNIREDGTCWHCHRPGNLLITQDSLENSCFYIVRRCCFHETNCQILNDKEIFFFKVHGLL